MNFPETKFSWTPVWAVVAMCFLAGNVFAAGLANDQSEMEIVWSESDGTRHEIYTSSFRAGSWDEPTQITDDESDNLHPSIDAGADGKKWVTWTAIDGSGFSIRYSVYENGEWQQSQRIPTSLSSNIKPSIIVDRADIPWVVWSGNNGDEDDIYFTRYQNGEWLEEQRVHEENLVPDILPFLDTDADGVPVVTWESYRDGSYKKLQSTWNGSKWAAPVELEPETLDEFADEQPLIVIPEFVNDTRQVFLRAFDPPVDAQEKSLSPE